MDKLRTIIRHFGRSSGLLLCLLVVLIQQPMSVFALSDDQKRVVDSGSLNFDVEQAGACVGGGSSGGNEALLSLTYPKFSSEPAIVAGIEKVVAETYSSSPWIGLGQWILDESKNNNVNPLFIVASGGVESAFGDSPWRDNYNYFGVDKGTRKFASTKDGILYFIKNTNENLSGGPDANQLYKDATNIYEYSSVHQTGGIFYPGQPFDPEDQDEKDGNTADLWDGQMDVYISWDPEANNRPEVNPKYKGNIYNPLSYYKLNISFINRITGLSFSDEPGGPGGCSTTAGANGWDLPGEGDHPMVYYSQRASGSDPAVEGYFGNDPYGPGPISHCGCGPTSWAMIVSTLTGNRVTPTEAAAWAATNNFQQPAGDDPCGGSSWWWVDNPRLSEAKWDVRAATIKIEEAKSILQRGGIVLLSVSEGPFTDGGHILVLRAFVENGAGEEDDQYLFADPNDYVDDREEAMAVFNGNSKSRTPLTIDQFSGSIKDNGVWAVTSL